MSSSGKDLRELVRNAVRQGWTTGPNGSGHVTLISPKGDKLTVAASPGGGRGYKNALARMRALGYQPGKRRRGGRE
jgi:hypothetical protein